MFALERSDSAMKFKFDKKTNIVKITSDGKLIGLCTVEESNTLLISLMKLKEFRSKILQIPVGELN
jgi:hypothetical protein